MLRISTVRRNEATVVHVEGRLLGDGVEELQRECGAANGPLTLDLSALLFADEVGLSFLRSLRDSGAVLAGASPFLELLLGGPQEERHRRGDAA